MLKICHSKEETPGTSITCQTLQGLCPHFINEEFGLQKGEWTSDIT